MFEIEKYVLDFFLIDNKKLTEHWENVFEQMAVHTRKKKPTELLLSIRPNEEQKILEYRLKNYRAITYGSMNRALDSASRILNKINYSVDAEDVTKEFLKTKEFGGYDFYKYLEKIIFKRDIEDPNGFLVWLPVGDGVTDSSQKVKPKPFLFYSRDLYDANDDVFSFRTPEKSLVTVGQKIVNIGEVFYLITKNDFFKLKQVGVESEKKFILELIYNHNINEIPVIILGGDMNADGFFESYFAPYVAFGDQAIHQFSDWQATMVTAGFPYREEFYTECEIRNINKKSSNPDAGEEKYSAEMEWRPIQKSPYGTIQRTIPGATQDSLLGAKVLDPSIPSIRFISPPVDVAKYSGESWEKLITMAEDALHLNLANGTTQSGIAKEKDLEQERAMIDKIANNFFGHIMFNSLKYIEAYLLNIPIENVSITINSPSTFVIKTEAELIDELAILKEKNVPSLFLSQATIELANRRFSGSPTAQKIFEAISIIDPLYIYDVDQKNTMLLSGVIDKDAYIRSVYIYSLILKISYDRTEKEFVKLTVDDISNLFDIEIDQYLSDQPAQIFDASGNQQSN